MLKERLCLTGVCPERALARFCRQGIAVFDAVKVDAKTLRFCVNRAQVKKVLEIYPDAVYQRGAYSVRVIPARGLLKLLRALMDRVGVILGGLAFVILLSLSDRFLLKIDVDAPTVYVQQIEEVLAQKGVRRYVPYQKGKEDLICSSLLALDGVSYCSVKKSGSVLYVVLKTNSFSTIEKEKELFAERTGVLTSLVVLRGTPLKEEGATVQKGERLVEGALYSEEGERTPTRVVAYATLACTYRQRYVCETQEQAFARAYLHLGLQGGEITKKKIEKVKDGYDVEIEYLWTQSVG